MALPININELINGKTVEWERIEFREGWNPERILKTICAFANDFNNWGGGYIILGIAEKDGRPLFPPIGIQLNQIDSIQKKLYQICRKILPNYFPIVEPVDYQNKKLLILCCHGGSNRPYKAPNTLGKNPQYFHYIRRYSLTVRPNKAEEKELLSMANQIPFDDQVNHSFQLSDLDLSTIKTFLNEVNSDLESEMQNLTINEIARRMNIAEGSNENLLPKNVGLLFFAKQPQNAFPYAKIEIITFSDEYGTDYTEKIFSGSLHLQLKNALDYLNSMVIKEKVVKYNNRAESDRFFNYPYDALEEALCNAVYHRGYDNDSTIEVRIYPSRISIISFPGPLPPLDEEKLKNNIFDVRKYRNRRIGEFLKELHLTEGRATGIPTILKALETNRSPNPIFETDKDRTFFKITLPINPFTLPEEKLISQYETLSDKAKEIIKFCRIPQKRSDIFIKINLTNQFVNYKKFLLPLIDNNYIEMTIPDKPNSSKQKYVTNQFWSSLLLKYFA